ncbi:uncharacterized protein LOC141627923 [Silene latifolia]|uniref:uncharacterized protein LOC141627923 n=1 Tax=Silene latifolia TaxID=37657 RepID=UPI003D76E38F
MIYAHNDIVSREELWSKMKMFAMQCDGPWAMAGDFNCVLTPEERLRGQSSIAEMAPFRDCLDQCGMIDIPATGSKFTWNNKQGPDSRVFSRLDRFLVNQEWLDCFPDLQAHFHPEGLFDHNPCTVSSSLRECIGRPPFRYYNMWGQAVQFQAIIQQGWRMNVAGTRMFKIFKKLKALKGMLRKLNRECYADIENNADIAKGKLEEIQERLQQAPTDPHLIMQEIETAQAYRELANARSSYLAQKAKTKWMESGDSNTGFFHGIIKKRMLKNQVLQIEDQNGNVCTTGASIQEAFLDYYKQLLGSSKPSEKVNISIVKKGRCCTEEHSAILNSAVTKEEIKQAIFSIPNDKSPGPDGYTSKFFKDAWGIVGEKVTEAILNFFDTGKLLNQINATTVTLIPKVHNPGKVQQFSPIACCNVIYKTISKLLCNRLSEVLPDIISQNQSAFVQGRYILENVMICQDIIKFYNRQSVSPRCLFKIDLQKAYDSVEWQFVDQMLQALKIPDKFRNLIMMCVTSPSFSLNLNGNHFGYFKGRRGLRQGDPISPLLFVICMEYLTRIIDYAVQKWPFNIILCVALSSFTICYLKMTFYYSAKKLPVGWSKICLPKEEGGLRVTQIHKWNDAAVNKLVDWVYTQPDRIWVKWVRATYIKNQEWETYEPGLDVAWYWKKICKMKTKFAAGFQNGNWILDDKGYSIKSGYEWSRNRELKFQWHKTVWSDWAIPKQSVITWLCMHKALNVRAKLKRIGYTDDDGCVLCGNGVETHDHLFFSCEYSSMVLAVVERWSSCRISRTDPIHGRAPGTLLQELFHGLLICCCYYMIWMQRNKVRLEMQVRHPEQIAKEIIASIFVPIISEKPFAMFFNFLTKKLEILYLMRPETVNYAPSIESTHKEFVVRCLVNKTSSIVDVRDMKPVEIILRSNLGNGSDTGIYLMTIRVNQPSFSLFVEQPSYGSCYEMLSFAGNQEFQNPRKKTRGATKDTRQRQLLDREILGRVIDMFGVMCTYNRPDILYLPSTVKDAKPQLKVNEVNFFWCRHLKMHYKPKDGATIEKIPSSNGYKQLKAISLFPTEIKDVSQQANTFDCGVYVMKFLESAMFNTDLWTDKKHYKDLIAYRREIMLRLIKWEKNTSQVHLSLQSSKYTPSGGYIHFFDLLDTILQLATYPFLNY